jgi:hypothetical protein
MPVRAGALRGRSLILVRGLVAGDPALEERPDGRAAKDESERQRERDQHRQRQRVP